MRSKMWKRNLAVLTAFGMVSGAGMPGTWMKPVTANAESGITLSNPRIEKDEDMEAGQNVTWDCIYFGSYPQREVVEDADDYHAIYEEYADFDKDAIEDAELFAELEEADEEDWDVNNEILLDGEKYRRMKRSDATYRGTSYKEESCYNWENYSDWHYFKYEPIKWRVLHVERNKALLLADKVLDDRKYHTSTKWENITWKTSTIRSWLNGYGENENQQGEDYSVQNFIDSAFDRKEQEAILTTKLENADNLTYGTEGGEDTEDSIFLLSENEIYASEDAAAYGFKKAFQWDDFEEEEEEIADEAKRRKSSTYAKAMGIWSLDREDYAGNCLWWLRTPGDDTNDAMRVDLYGCVDREGYYVNGDEYGVCPALNLDLSSSDLWSYAGTVNSGGYAQTNSGVTADGIHYTVYEEEGYAAITGYEGTAKELTLPQSVNGVPVKEIEGSAFSGCETLEKITFPDSLTGIGEYAFSGCSALKSVNFPAGLQWIEMGGFSGCTSLTSLSLPDQLRAIGSSAFSDCTGLEQVVIPASVTHLPDNPFAGCENLSSISVAAGNTKYDSRDNCNAVIDTENDELIAGCKNTVIPLEITSIGSEAFSGCSVLTSVTLPDNLKQIGSRAFYGCKYLTDLYIPEKVNAIGFSAFAGCESLDKINVAAGNTSYDSRDNCNAIIDTENAELIAGCNNSKIPVDIERICAYAFFGCRRLKKIEIPASVTYIGTAAFSGCSGLDTIIVATGNTEYDSRNNCNAIIEKESNTLIVGCKTTKIPSGIEKIGEQAFANCDMLESIEIPDSVEQVEAWAFSGCTGLKQVKLSKNLKYINMNCFSECSSLEDIVIPEGVTQLAPGAFMHCSSLKNVELPSTLEGIYEHAFARCTSLTKLTIPQKVEVIAYGAFLGCSSLKDIYYPGTKAQWDEINIIEKDNDILKMAAIHYGSAKPSDPQPVKPAPVPSNPPAQNSQATAIKAGYTAKVGQAQYRVTAAGTARTVEYQKPATKTQKTVKIPAAVTINGEVYKVTSIAKNACKGNKKLKTITISKNIKTIGANAFAGCKNLKTIRIASTSLTKKSVGKNAFKGIHKKAVIKVPKKKLKAYKKFLKGKGQAKSVKIKK